MQRKIDLEWSLQSTINGTLPPEAVEQIRMLSERLDGITERLADRAAMAAVPSTLFHYTNAAGLTGIVASGRLRLSDIFNLNDPSEMRHGVQFALRALQEAAAGGHRGAKLFVWKFSEQLTGDIEGVSRQFVACFSPRGDDLSQWRAYADNGKGYALGFDGPRLEAAFGKLPHLTATFAVNYDESLLREAVAQIAIEALRVAEFPVGKGYDGPALSAFLHALSVQTSNAILYTAMYFKHPAYEIEREYRFQHVRAVNDAQGIVTVGKRSYIEFDCRSHDVNLLTDIVIGPAGDQELANLSARDLLRTAGIDPPKVRIERSAIPYRG